MLLFLSKVLYVFIAFNAWIYRFSVCYILCRMKCARMDQLLSVLICALLLLKAEGISVPITYVQSAVPKGAGEEVLLCVMMGNLLTLFFVIHLSCSLLLSTVYSNSCQNWCLSSCAVCLDGSPPAYHLHKGFGAGIDNWIVHFEVCPFLQTGINNESLPTHENFWAHLFLFSFSLFTVYYINHWKQKID